MPNLGFGEIIVILLVALLVFGPRKLPEIGRTMGKSMREFRRATAGWRAELEADVDEDDDEQGTRVRSDWQRRSRDGNGAEPNEPVDPAEVAPDDGGSMPGPDPSGGTRD